MRIKIFLLAFIGAAGCAINDKGLVDVESYESETARAVQLRAWGFIVSTTPVDRGFTIGFSKKAYVFQKRDIVVERSHDIKSQFLDVWQAGGLALSKTNPPECLGNLGIPVAIVSEQIGVSFDMNSQRAGVTIGLKQEQAIRLPSDHEGILFLNYDTINPWKSQIYLHEITHLKENR
jgi:hypothetical protein